MENRNVVTINATHAAAWAVAAVGIGVGLISLAMIWVTRDMWLIASQESAFMRDRIATLERQHVALEQEVRTQKAYIDRFVTPRTE